MSIKPNKCRHCGDNISEWTCKIGDKHDVVDQCRTCHNELAHGIIRNQNVHIIGGGTICDFPEPGGAWENAVREYEEGYIPSRRALSPRE